MRTTTYNHRRRLSLSLDRRRRDELPPPWRLRWGAFPQP